MQHKYGKCINPATGTINEFLLTSYIFKSYIYSFGGSSLGGNFTFFLISRNRGNDLNGSNTGFAARFSIIPEFSLPANVSRQSKIFFSLLLKVRR